MVIFQRVDENVVLLKDIVPVVIRAGEVLHNKCIESFIFEHPSANLVTIFAVDGNAGVGLLDQ